MKLSKRPWSIGWKLVLLPLLVTAVVSAETLRNTTVKRETELYRSYSGTTELSAQGQGLAETLHSHFVTLDADGKLRGRISSIVPESESLVGVSDLKIYFVQNSEVIESSSTDEDGNFEVADLAEGIYTLCAAGKNGFLAYGIYVLAPSEDQGEALPVPGRGGPFAPELYQEVAADLQIQAAVVPPEFHTLESVMSDHLPEAVSEAIGTGEDIKLNVKEAIVTGGFRISLDEGRLTGRIAPVGTSADRPTRLREMNAFLIVDDEIYSRVAVEDDGNFAFEDVDPGVYAFAAAGEDGFAALSFQAVVADAGDIGPQTGPNDGERLVGMQVALTPPEDSEFLLKTIRELNKEPEPQEDEDDEGAFLPPGQGGMVGGPGGAGGFGGAPGVPYGGGGGGFAGGGLGDWLGPALGAGVLLWALNNLDNRPVQQAPPLIPPPPISPFTNF